MNKKIINKKRFKFSHVNKFFILIISFILLFFFLNYIPKIQLNFKFLIENLSSKYQYTFTNLEIKGLKLLNKKDLKNEFSRYINKSIFLIPIKKISKKISQNNWIKSVKIINNYHDTLFVTIEEEIPFGIYVRNGKNILFSNNLKILNFISKDDEFFSKLIKFEGNNSINQSIIFIDILSNKFIKLIDKAIFINNRRWNVLLKNGILLKLPESNIIESLNKYEKIYLNFSNRELNDIESIDLRIFQKAIIKYD